MNSIQGKPLSSEKKFTIIQLKQYFDKKRSEFGVTDLSTQLISDALGVGLATVNRVLANYNKNPNSINEDNQIRGRPAYSVDRKQQEQVRAYIRQANLQGKHITLETIYDFLKPHISNEFHVTTLARTLDRWGFEFGKGIRTQHLKEKDYVIAARHRYLRKMRNNREKNSVTEIIRPEVYLDESYVNKNHSNDFVWYSADDGPWIQKPTGSGERLIIINAITKNGWIPKAKTVFKSTRRTGDYHGQMNAELFQKWFTEQLIPNIPKNSIIVMDNASYHNILSDISAPIATSAKKDIIAWLEKNNIPVNPDCLKPELIEVLNKIAPEPTYTVDEIARKNGHEIIRTPPYHPELQPIEICWGIVKNEIARNCDFTMKNLEIQLEKAFDIVTVDTCLKIIKKIRGIEDAFWAEDTKIDLINEKMEQAEEN